MRRVNFNDGEGVVFSDFNMMATLSERGIARRMVRGALTSDSFDVNPVLYLIRGSNFSLSGTGLRTVTLTQGYYCQDESPASNDAPDVAFGENVGAAYVLDAPTSGSVYRRDILEAKIETESSGESETRDFKDAVTGVVSSQSMNKRGRRLTTIQVKKGTDQTSETLANQNEPTPTAGFTKIYSVLIPNTGDVSESKVWDWHLPWRRYSHFVAAGAPIMPFSGSSVTFAYSSGYGPKIGWPSGVSSSVTGRAHAEYVHYPQVNGRLIDVISLAKVRDNGGAFDFQLYLPTASGTFSVLDFTAEYTGLPNTVETLKTIVLTSMSIAVKPPIWMTGSYNRNFGFEAGVLGPLYWQWAEQGDGTAEGRLYWLNWHWQMF